MIASTIIVVPMSSIYYKRYLLRIHFCCAKYHPNLILVCGNNGHKIGNYKIENSKTINIVLIFIRINNIN